MRNDTIFCNVGLDIPYLRVADLLTTAFEGGSNYWIRSVETQTPTVWRNLDPQTRCLADYVLNDGGKLTFTITEPFDDSDTIEYTLDMTKVREGLQVFLRGEGFGMNGENPHKVPHHAANFINENDDAITGDVFLQICLFGEVIFG